MCVSLLQCWLLLYVQELEDKDLPVQIRAEEAKEERSLRQNWNALPSSNIGVYCRRLDLVVNGAIETLILFRLFSPGISDQEYIKNQLQ